MQQPFRKRIKRFQHYPRLILKYGTLHPEKAKVPGSATSIHINPRDERAFQKIALRFAQGKTSLPMRFFREFQRRMPENTLFLDVGANYGEVSASLDFSKGPEILMVEANPEPFGFLARSSEDFRSMGARAEAIQALVSDTCGEPVTLFVDSRWSGRSSVTQTQAHDRKIEVVSRTIDSILTEREVPPSRPICFKMDVEGHEPKAMRGFELLRRAPKMIGIMEFSDSAIRNGGESASNFIRDLAESFFLFTTDDNLHLQPITRIEQLQKSKRRDVIHLDLVISSHNDWN